MLKIFKNFINNNEFQNLGTIKAEKNIKRKVPS